jgi:hypothetical protein
MLELPIVDVYGDVFMKPTIKQIEDTTLRLMIFNNTIGKEAAKRRARAKGSSHVSSVSGASGDVEVTADVEVTG